MRARLLVAILSLALAYALTCSATCALCLQSSTAAATASHECGQVAPDAPGGTHQPNPAKPECAAHHHPNLDVLQGDGLARFHLFASSYLHASQLSAGVVGVRAVVAGDLFFSDLAPPQNVMNFPQLIASILRI